jgi:hypothetical protein
MMQTAGQRANYTIRETDTKRQAVNMKLRVQFCYFGPKNSNYTWLRPDCSNIKFKAAQHFVMPENIP